MQGSLQREVHVNPPAGPHRDIERTPAAAAAASWRYYQSAPVYPNARDRSLAICQCVRNLRSLSPHGPHPSWRHGPTPGTAGSGMYTGISESRPTGRPV